MSFKICLQDGCKYYKKPIYATNGAWFAHYNRKGRDVLIQLALETGISQRPYSLPTWILVDKLVKKSKINREEIT